MAVGTGRLSLVAAYVVGTTPALAEVADKVPSQIEIWISPVGIGLTAYVLGRIHPWLSLIPWPIGIVWAWVMLTEMWDLTPALQIEMGRSYLVTVYIASALVSIAPPLFAAWFHSDRRATQHNR